MQPPAQSQSDEELLRRFSAGDRAAFETLARRHEQNLLGLALGFLRGDRTLACDAVQETWVRVVRFAGTFAGQSSFKTWVCRILINQCRSLASLVAERRSQPSVSPPPVAESNKSQIEDAERINTLREGVSRLDEDKQAILLLCYHEGMTHETAAGVSPAIRFPCVLRDGRLSPPYACATGGGCTYISFATRYFPPSHL